MLARHQPDRWPGFAGIRNLLELRPALGFGQRTDAVDLAAGLPVDLGVSRAT
jgi:hypothetical protein